MLARVSKVDSFWSITTYGQGVVDPVHYRPDPDPANQNLKTGSVSFLHSPRIISNISFFFSHVKQIFSDIFMCRYVDFFTRKNGKNHLKIWKKLHFKNLNLFWYNFKKPEKDLDPAKRYCIRIRNPIVNHTQDCDSNFNSHAKMIKICNLKGL